MVRLGILLAVHSGREALTRLIFTTLAVAAGVTLLLVVLADFHAFQASGNRSCWECTRGVQVTGSLPAHGELWTYSVDFFQGQTIERLDVAALGPDAPLPPGIRRLPGAGQYYASPALAELLRKVPADQLGDRFPGALAGTIGDRALSGPAELVIYVGYTPGSAAAPADATLVTAIQTSPPKEVFTPYFKYAFAVAVLAVLFPILILIGTATRLAAARREERFAALRLIGATPRDINVIASVDSVVSALFGAVLGVVLFAAIQPVLADAAFIGTRYFAYTVTPTVWGYLAMIVAVPLAAAAASLMSLRRVRISPLGVSRRVSAPPPSAWRLVTLFTGIALFVTGLLLTTRRTIGAPTYPGLLVVMTGLVIGGPWLTAAAARLCARVLPGASPLLAARRLADNPKAAFRSVSGLVLAVFLGTMVGALVPAVDSLIATPGVSALRNVLLGTFAAPPKEFGPNAPPQAGGLAPPVADHLVGDLRAIQGAMVFPLYATPPDSTISDSGEFNSIIGCATLRQLAALGQCAPGAQAVAADDSSLLYSDNPRFSTQAFVTPANPVYSGSLSGLYLQAVLVRVNSAATLERVRTYLATHTRAAGGPRHGDAVAAGGPAKAEPSATPPRTFGEAVAIRTARAATVQRLVFIAVALTILVAGCSLAVAIGGGLVDRKRPFTMLRVSGTPVGTLYKVVFLEAVFPLAGATLAAAGVAYGMSVLAINRMAPKGTPVPALGHLYYETIGAGLAVSLLVILVTLPILGRVTGPGSVRFE